MRGLNNFLVQIESPLVEQVVGENGTKFYLAAKFHYEWNVSVTGKVLSVPANEKNIKVGDEIAFSYLVVNTKSWGNKGDKVFSLSIDGGEIEKEWTAGNGNTIKKIKNPIKINRFTAYLFDKSYDIIDVIEGTENEIEGWLAQFDFEDNCVPVNENLIEIDGVEMWKVAPEFVFAVKKEDDVISYNNYTVLSPITNDITKKLELMGAVLRPSEVVMEQYNDRGMVLATNDSIGLEQGDIAAIDGRYTEKYDLWGRPCLVVRKECLLGKFSNN